MKRILEYLWPAIGLGAVAFSGWLLWREFQGNSMDDLWQALKAIPAHRWLLVALATLAAYAALAGYDRVALMHLGKLKGISLRYIALCSFTTYALSHNIGASVVSGGMVRYRAYSAKGLSAAEVAVLVAFCSLTFALGMAFCGGIVFTFEPDLIHRLLKLPEWSARLIGIACLAFVVTYLAASLLNLKAFQFRTFRLEYPHWPVAIRQLVIAPLEIIAAAAIIYFALPEAGNPGFFIVLGVFVAVFSAALISQAPGGLGVMEVLFIAALPGIPKLDVLAALLVFRLFYLLIPLALSVPIVLLFEKAQLAKAHSEPTRP